MTPRLPAFLLAAALALSGCDEFATAQSEDTIEAYEQYLERNPTGRFELQARSRLEQLYLQRAGERATLEAYDEVITRFPNGALKERTMAERESFLFRAAEDAGTEEAWQRFVDEYPKAERKRRQASRRALAAAKYQKNLATTEIQVRDINLAEDPNGPLDGKAFTMDVTNNGDQTLTTLEYIIQYLDAQGRPLDQREWPVVAPQFPIPMEEEKLVPIVPGETRTWEWTTGELPDGWSGKVRVYPSNVAYASAP